MMNKDVQEIVNSNLSDSLKVALLRRLGEAEGRDHEVQYLSSALRCAMLKLDSPSLVVKVSDFVPTQLPMKVEQVNEELLKFTLPEFINILPAGVAPSSPGEPIRE